VNRRTGSPAGYTPIQPVCAPRKIGDPATPRIRQSLAVNHWSFAFSLRREPNADHGKNADDILMRTGETIPLKAP
jgi:hypothetical protein